MRLLELELRNVCQHEHLLWKFGTGLIGVFGPNGSGKSNTMNLACYAAVTGDYARHPQGKQGMIRQQASKRAKSEIRLSFLQDGTEYTVLRGLQGPVCNRLCRPGKPDLVNANEIKRELVEVLGLSRRVIDDYAFVSQDALFGFVDGNADRRAKALSELFGLSHLEACYNALSDQAREDSRLVVGYAEVADRLRSTVADYEQRLQQVEADIYAQQQRLLSRKAAAACREAVAIAPRLVEAEQTYKALYSEWRDLLKEKAETRALLVASQETIEQITAACEERQAENPNQVVEQLRAQLEENDNRRKASESWEARLGYAERARSELEKLRQEQQELAESAPSERSATALAVEDAVLEEEEKQLNRSIEATKGKSQCPVCKTPLSGEALARVADYPERLSRVISRRQEIIEELELSKEYEHHVSLCEEAVAKCAVRLEFFSKKTQGEKPEYGEEGYAEYEKILADLASWGERAEKYTEAVAEAGTAAALLSRVETSLMTNGSKLEEAAEQRGDVAAATEAASAAEAKLEVHKDANRQLDRLRGRRDELRREIRDREKEVEELEAKGQLASRARDWVELLEALRKNVFSRDKLPQRLRAVAMHRIGVQVNERLQAFGKPFRTEVTETADIDAIFPNGTRVPATALSGGQKVMLALTYRAAATALFARELGMMVFDEPTDGLDHDNRDLAVEVFRQVGEDARIRGQQIFVITHDDLLGRVFDQKLELRRSAAL